MTYWPWQNWLIWLGLVSLGYVEKADAIRDAMREAFRALDGMPEEAFAVATDESQAIYRMRVNPVQVFSAGALLHMLTSVGASECHSLLFSCHAELHSF